MEHPLHSLPRLRNDLLLLARALLYADLSLAAHEEMLGSAFTPAPPPGLVQRLAGRTLAWTSLRPQPRAKALARQLQANTLLNSLLKKHVLHPPSVVPAPRMRRWAETDALPSLTTVHDLAQWLRVDLGYLQWFADLADRNARVPGTRLQHYNRRIIVKKSGAIRLLESPKQHLKHIQRQIHREILSLLPQHPAVHGFRRGRSTVTFAAPHVGRQLVLRLDLQDFFPSCSGPRIQALFRTLGYPEHVADLLGGLCTTTTHRSFWQRAPTEVDPVERQRARELYARTHLPQGAPTSPTLANLCALRLDRRLTALAEACGAVYTRYADDLAFSGDGSFARTVGRFAPQVAAIASEEGFSVQHHKTRLMRRSVRQELAGVVVNAKPNLRREEIDGLKATLRNCITHGPSTQNRDGHPDFRAYLTGRVAYVGMVNPSRGARLRALLDLIVWS